jgi:2-hydroxy-6-oxonona-2,4-dienedioate hydrolase
VEASLRATIENIAGVSTRYLHHGEGDYGIFLLHGVGVSADSWLWNLEQIGSNAWAIAPDLLGYGMTGEGDYKEGAPQEGIVEHLVAVVDHLKVRKVMIVGSSFGANIACHLTRRLGSKVDGLVLVGCGPALNTPPLLAAMYEKSFSNGIAAMRQPTIDVCRRRMNNLVHNAASVPEALLMLQLSLYALPGAADRYERRMRGIKEISALHRFDITARVQELSLPTLVIWGRQDARGDLEEAERFASMLPNGEMLIYEKCGHLPYLEYPERFNSDIAKFLSAVRQ